MGHKPGSEEERGSSHRACWWKTMKRPAARAPAGKAQHAQHSVGDLDFERCFGASGHPFLPFPPTPWSPVPRLRQMITLNPGHTARASTHTQSRPLLVLMLVLPLQSMYCHCPISPRHVFFRHSPPIPIEARNSG